MSVTEADRIAAAGIPLTLGGREVRVRFCMHSWREIEDRYESLEQGIDVLRQMLNATPKAPFKKPVRPTGEMLWAALYHEGMTEDEVLDLMDVHDLTSYQAALFAAVVEGTPGPGPGKDELAADSPGPTTTTPSPSDTAAAMASSGV